MPDPSRPDRSQRPLRTPAERAVGMNKLIASIHAAGRRLGLDEDTRRDRIERLTGTRSLKDLSFAQLGRVLDDFNAGWKGPMGHRPHIAKVKALWWTLYWLGAIGMERSDISRAPDKNSGAPAIGMEPSGDIGGAPVQATGMERSDISGAPVQATGMERSDISGAPDKYSVERALDAFVQRQAKVTSLRFLDARRAPAVIEALKSMCEREGVKWPPAEHKPSYANDLRTTAQMERHAVLDAIWAKLWAMRAATEPCYVSYVQKALHLPLSHHHWSAHELDAAIRLLGRWLRRSPAPVRKERRP